MKRERWLNMGGNLALNTSKRKDAGKENEPCNRKSRKWKKRYEGFFELYI